MAFPSKKGPSKSYKRENPFDRAKKSVANAKSRFNQMKTDGVKGTLMRGAKGLGSKAKSSQFVQKIANTIKKAKKTIVNIARFVRTFWIPILIIVGLIVISLTVVPYIYAVTQTFGNSPHYYCMLDAPSSVKQTAAYQQYCGKGGGIGNEDLATAAIALLEPTSPSNGSDIAAIHRGLWSDYMSISDKTNTQHTSGQPANCTGYTAVVIRWCVDDQWIIRNPDMYLTEDRQKLEDDWDLVWSGTRDEIAELSSQKKLDEQFHPGDLFISEADGGSSHIFFYVGRELLEEHYPDTPEDHDSIAAGWECYLPRTQSVSNEANCHVNWHVFRWQDGVEPHSAYKDVTP